MCGDPIVVRVEPQRHMPITHAHRCRQAGCQSTYWGRRGMPHLATVDDQDARNNNAETTVALTYLAGYCPSPVRTNSISSTWHAMPCHPPDVPLNRFRRTPLAALPFTSSRSTLAQGQPIQQGNQTQQHPAPGPRRQHRHTACRPAAGRGPHICAGQFMPSIWSGLPPALLVHEWWG